MTSELHVYCPVCGSDRPAELLSADGSVDAHDDEALCSDCGIGLFLDPPVVAAASAA